jgi:sporulation protein YlmC with PRC-barrel domain
MMNLGRAVVLFAWVGLVFIFSSTISSANSTPEMGNSSPPRTQAGAQPVDLGSRARDLMGKTVQSIRGEALGLVTDLVINTGSGRLEYVIISSGGFGGIGGRQKAVPPGAVSVATVKRNVVALDTTRERWQGAPEFNQDLIAKPGDPAQARRIYQYYQKPWPATMVPAPSPSNPSSTFVGSESGQTGRLQLASELIGKRIRNRQGQTVGKIIDLLVDLGSPKAVFAILKPGSFITRAGKQAADPLFAVPVHDLATSDRSNQIILDVAPAQFQRAQTLGEDNWMLDGRATGFARVYRYRSSGSDDVNRVAADNTGRNIRDRQPDAITPTDQSESRKDLQVASGIRQALVKNDGLSRDARNIKVITGNGRVVLRGPVRSEREKDQIGRLAEQAAGTGNVENNLEVTQR